MPNTTLTKTEIADWIRAWMIRELTPQAQQIEADKNFIEYGMDSVYAAMLLDDLEEYLACSLPLTLVWDHPSPESLANHLVHSALAGNQTNA